MFWSSTILTIDACGQALRRLSVFASILSLRHSLCYSPNSSKDRVYQGHFYSVEVAVSASASSHLVSSFSHHYSRRKTFSIVCSLSCAAAFIPLPLPAKEQPTNDSDMSILKEATKALSSLLQNWEKATIDCCTYADVPRELLEAKNKEKLLEKVTVLKIYIPHFYFILCLFIFRLPGIGVCTF
jgi:hypothetical protein